MRRKTIRSLMSDKKAVYVKLSCEKVAKVFFALAEYEGFTVNGDIVRYGVRDGSYVRLNGDGSISFPEYHSWAGALLFYHAKKENGKKVVKYDFEEFLN